MLAHIGQGLRLEAPALDFAGFKSCRLRVGAAVGWVAEWLSSCADVLLRTRAVCRASRSVGLEEDVRRSGCRGVEGSAAEWLSG